MNQWPVFGNRQLLRPFVLYRNKVELSGQPGTRLPNHLTESTSGASGIQGRQAIRPSIETSQNNLNMT